MVERAKDKLKEIYGEIREFSHQNTQFLIYNMIDTGVDRNNIINAISDCTPLGFSLCLCPLCKGYFDIALNINYDECFADSMISTIEMFITNYSTIMYATLGKITLDKQTPILLSDNDKNELCRVYEDVMYQEHLLEVFNPNTDSDSDSGSDFDTDSDE